MLGEERVLRLIEKYKKSDLYFEIPFCEFYPIEDYKFLEWYGFEIQRYLSKKLKICFFVCYDKSVIIFNIGDKNMKYEITVKIPYGKRREYSNFVAEVNSLVDQDGLVALFVCNIPYKLEAYLVIETNNAYDEIIALINKNKLEITYSKGRNELFYEMIKYRKYNSISYTEQMSVKDIERSFDGLFYFADEKQLLDNGYNSSMTIKKKKVFISYCHNEKEVVYKIRGEMKSHGIDCWIDEQDIMEGEHILASVLKGINESDLALMFISKSTLSSNFSQLELQNVMSAMMGKGMGWFIVKLDDVNPDDILPSLNNYKYYDFSKNSNIEDLLLKIKLKLNSLSKNPQV